MIAATHIPAFRTVFSMGFRPFFLGAGVWAVVAMVLWLGFLSGTMALPGGADPFAWHAHALVFGYVGAALAGFLLTAAPNWTKQSPVTGLALAALFALWLAGRLSMLFASVLPSAFVAVLDLGFGVALASILALMVWRGRNWRNLSVLAAVSLWIIGNVVFHWEVAQGLASSGLGVRLGLAGAVSLVALVGGRVVPAFTRNWLKARGAGGIKSDPDWLDFACNGLLAGAALLWALLPDAHVTAFTLALVAILHLWRLSRWRWRDTLSEPLLWVLLLAYLFVPFGAFALALASAGVLAHLSAQHVWAVGAVGLMTLAVMTRATLGHSGGALTAGPGTAVIYGLLCFAAVARPLSDLFPLIASALLSLSALAWIGAFSCYVALYGARQLGVSQTKL